MLASVVSNSLFMRIHQLIQKHLRYSNYDLNMLRLCRIMRWYLWPWRIDSLYGETEKIRINHNIMLVLKNMVHASQQSFQLGSQ